MNLSFGTDLHAPPPEPESQTPTPGWWLVGDPAGRAGALAASDVWGDFKVVEPEQWSVEGRDPGLVVVLLSEIGAESLVDLMSVCVDADDWVVVGVRESGECRVLNASSPYRPEEIRPAFLLEEAAPYLLDLRRIMKDVSHARHDINNPLTSALAETQLALMDEPGGELQESLETVQRQLRRMRDLLKMLAPIRMRLR